MITARASKQHFNDGHEWITKNCHSKNWPMILNWKVTQTIYLRNTNKKKNIRVQHSQFKRTQKKTSSLGIKFYYFYPRKMLISLVCLLKRKENFFFSVGKNLIIIFAFIFMVHTKMCFRFSSFVDNWWKWRQLSVWRRCANDIDYWITTKKHFLVHSQTNWWKTFFLVKLNKFTPHKMSIIPQTMIKKIAGNSTMHD